MNFVVSGFVVWDGDVIEDECVGGVLGVGGGVIVTIEGDSATISATDFFLSVGFCSFKGRGSAR